jgi:hypothetical protein
MPDIFLRQGAANPSDIILRDPTVGGVVNYSLAIGVGAFALVGKDITLTYTAGFIAYSINADVGTFSVNGKPVDLLRTGGASQNSGGQRKKRNRRSPSPYFEPAKEYVLAVGAGQFIVDGAWIELTLTSRVHDRVQAAIREIDRAMQVKKNHELEIIELLLHDIAA